MKFLFIVLLAVLSLSSCKKEDFGQYHKEPEVIYNEPHDSTTYIYSGTLPTNNGTNNDLVGTSWVLTKYVSAFATEYPYDTINFVSYNTYTINGGAVRTYQITSNPLSANYTLSLYFFFPFGGSHYSGEIGNTFISDGEINNTDFNNIQNTSSIIKAWFNKI